MKILARSVLMLIALGFATFDDLLNSPNVNAFNLAIVAEDSDDDQDETKCCTNPLDNAVLIWAPHWGGATSTQASPRLLDTSSTARYKLFSVYRI